MCLSGWRNFAAWLMMLLVLIYVLDNYVLPDSRQLKCKYYAIGFHYQIYVLILGISMKKCNYLIKPCEMFQIKENAK